LKSPQSGEKKLEVWEKTDAKPMVVKLIQDFATNPKLSNFGLVIL
jgi:hypothetical protein